MSMERPTPCPLPKGRGTSAAAIAVERTVDVVVSAFTRIAALETPPFREGAGGGSSLAQEHHS
jgi:hypothetical protein